MKEKKKSSFAGKVSKDSHRQQTAGSSYGYLKLPKGLSVFSPDPDSRVILDFLPYEVTDKKHPDRDDDSEIATPGTLWYKRPFILHRNIGSEQDSVVCLASFGKRCPICEYRAKLQKEGADKETLEALKQSKRNLYIVIPKDSKKHEAKIHIFDISQYLFQGLLNDELEEETIPETFPELEEGTSLKIRFDSKTMGKGKPYAEASRIDPVVRKKQYKEDMLEEVPNLDEILTELTYEQLDAKFLEIENEEDDDADEKPKGKKKNKKDDEDEDEAPKRQRKSVKDEDEDEKPKGKKNKKEPEPEPEEEVDMVEVINDMETVEELLEVLSTYPETFDKATVKELKKLKKVKELKKAILEIVEGEEPEPEEPDEPEEPELTWGDLELLNESKLKKLIKANDLDVDPTDYDDDVKALRKAVAKEMDIDVPKANKKNKKEEPEEDDLPFKKGAKGKAPVKDDAKPGKEKCPHGHRFGVDADEKKECDTCKLWDACVDVKERR